MDQGRIEPTPAEQLSELRKARDRYAALAEKLHEGADPELEPDDIQAQEQNALRILHAYERSVANSETRMTSLGKTHRLPGRPLKLRTWLLIFVAISAIEGGVLLAYFRPAIFAPLMQLIGPMQEVLVPVAAPPKPIPALAPDLAAPAPAAPLPVPPIPKAQPKTPLPAARPQPGAAVVKTAPKPATPPTPASPPQPATASRPSPVIVPPAASPPPDAPSPQAAPQQTQPPIIAAPSPTAAAPPPVSLPPVSLPPPPQQTQPQQTQPQQTSPAPRPAIPAPTRLEAMAGTHTPPPYPDAAKRLGESGTTQIQVAVSPQGAASDCRIVKSSGSDRLDAAACSHVQQNWRWRPATLGGQPVASAVNVTIVWNLKDAR